MLSGWEESARPFAREPEKASRTLLRLSPLAQASSPPSLTVSHPPFFAANLFCQLLSLFFLPCLVLRCHSFDNTIPNPRIPNLISLSSRLVPKYPRPGPGPGPTPVPVLLLVRLWPPHRIASADSTTSPQFPCLQPRRCPAHHPNSPRSERTLALSQGTCQPRSTLRFSCTAPL